VKWITFAKWNDISCWEEGEGDEGAERGGGRGSWSYIHRYMHALCPKNIIRLNLTVVVAQREELVSLVVPNPEWDVDGEREREREDVMGYDTWRVGSTSPGVRWRRNSVVQMAKGVAGNAAVLIMKSW